MDDGKIKYQFVDEHGKSHTVDKSELDGRESEYAKAYPGDQMRMVRKDGVEGYVPASQVKDALKGGYRPFTISYNEKKETGKPQPMKPQTFQSPASDFTNKVVGDLSKKGNEQVTPIKVNPNKPITTQLPNNTPYNVQKDADREFETSIVPKLDQFVKQHEQKGEAERKEMLNTPFLSANQYPGNILGAERLKSQETDASNVINDMRNYLSSKGGKGGKVDPRTERLMERTVDYLAKKNMPKNTLEYIVKNAIDGSMLGSVNNLMMGKSNEQLNVENRGNEMYNPSTATKIASGIGSLALDMPLFGAGGKISEGVAKLGTRAVQKRIAGELISKAGGNLSKELAMQQAGRVMMSQNPKAVFSKILSSSVENASTLGGYNATQETLRQSQSALNGGKFDVGEIQDKGLEGALTGAVTGLFGSSVANASRNLSGVKRIASDAAGFIGDSSLFAGMNMLQKYANGEPVEPGKELVNSAAMLAAMRAGHIGSAVKNWSKASVEERQAMEKALSFTPEEKDILKSKGVDADNIINTIGQLSNTTTQKRNVPGKVITENGRYVVRENPTVEKRQFMSEYSRIMNDESVPLATKGKLLYMVEGKNMAMPLMTEYNLSGETLSTTDWAGRVIDTKKFKSPEDAKNYVEKNDLNNSILGNQVSILSDLNDNKINSKFERYHASDIASEMGVSKGEVLDALHASEPTEKQVEIINNFRNKVESDDKYLDNTSLGVLLKVKDETGIDVREALNKKEKTPEEEDAVALYLNDLKNNIDAKTVDTASTPEEKYNLLSNFQKASEEVKNADPNTTEGKEAIDNYNNAKEQFGQYVNSVNEKAKKESDRAANDIQENSNPDTGKVMTVNTSLFDQPVVVTGGNLVFNDDGTLNVNASDTEFYYRDPNTGKIKSAPVQDADGLVINSIDKENPIEDAVAEAKQAAENEVNQNEQAELDNYEQSITPSQSNAAPQSGEVNQNVQEEAQNNINSPQENIQNESMSPEEIKQNDSSTVNDVPRDKEGNVDYKKIDDPSLYTKSLKEEFGDEANSILDEQIDIQKKRLSNANKKGDAIERARAKKEINKELEKLNAVKSQFGEVPSDINNDADYIDWVSENSNDPNEIAGAYNTSKDLTENKLSPWQEELIGAKIDPKSYYEFGDRNKINGTFAKSWLKSGGDKLDTLSQELSSQFGTEIIPQDIVDFMDDNPTNYVRKTSDLQNKLSAKFSEVASKEMGIPVGGPDSNTGKLYLKLKNENDIGNLSPAETNDLKESELKDYEDKDREIEKSYLDSVDAEELAKLENEYKTYENDKQGKIGSVQDATGNGERIEGSDGEQTKQPDDRSTPGKSEQTEGKNSEDGVEQPFKAPEKKNDESLLDYAGRVASAKKINDEESKVDTNPSDAQKEAGNYKKGHLKIDGYDYTIENPKGSVRSGKNEDGNEWAQKMNNTYGYIKGTEGVDGDHIDMFLSDDPNKGNVYVVDQIKPDGTFDEHKVMYGFNSKEDAEKAYLSNYSDGWNGVGNITEVSKENFKKWIDSSKRKTKPFAEYSLVKPSSLFDTSKYEGSTIYHGSPDGKLDSIDPYLHTRNWKEGIGFYTTENEEKAKEYADGRTARGDRKNKDGYVNTLTFPKNAKIIDMDSPADMRMWNSFADDLDVSRVGKVKSNMEAYQELINNYDEDTGSNEGQYAVEECLSNKGYNASTHIEGKSNTPHRVFIWKDENLLPKISNKEKNSGLGYAKIKYMDGSTHSGEITSKNKDNISIKSPSGRTYTVKKENVLETSNSPIEEELYRRGVEQSKKETDDKIISYCDNLGKSLNTKINYDHVDGNVKGWYDPNTDEVHINLDNTVDEDDAGRTIFHEIVAHKGLRKMFGENFDEAMHSIYSSLSERTRREINKDMLKHPEYNLDTSKSTEEYIARLAESGAPKPSIWKRILSTIKSMLRNAGIKLKMSDDDLKYMLWKSRNRMENTPEYLAKDFDVQSKIYSSDMPKPQEPLFRIDNLEKSSPQDQIEATKTMAELSDESKESSLEREKRQRLFEAWVDKTNPIRVFQDTLMKEYGEELPENCDAHFAYNAMTSRAANEKSVFRSTMFDPMLKAVSKIGDYDETCNYLMAKHGIERNEYMRNLKIADLTMKFEKAGRSIDSDSFKKEVEKIKHTDYAGLTGIQRAIKGDEKELKDTYLDEDFINKYISDFEKERDADDLDDMFLKIKIATDFVIETQKKYGCISRQKADEIENMFKYYVPLRGWSDPKAEDFFEYFSGDKHGLNMPLKKMKGRVSKAGDPLANIASMADTSVVTGNKNFVKQHLFRLVFNYPSNIAHVSPVYITVDPVTSERREFVFNPLDDKGEPLKGDAYDEAFGAFTKKMDDMVSKGLAMSSYKDLKVGMPITKTDAEQHSVRVLVNGVPQIIYMDSSPRAAQAINGDNVVSVDVAGLNQIRDAQNWMARNYTSKKLNFMFSNFCRDMSGALTYNYIYGYSKEGTFVKSFTPAANALREYLFSKKMPDNKYGTYLSEFLNNGGETGYGNSLSYDDYVKDIKNDIDKIKHPNKIQVFRATSKGIELLNRQIEDSTRFTAYVSSREDGNSVAKSIKAAKEISVNFNRSGSGAYGNAIMRIFKMFLNPSIQGLYNVVRAFKLHPGRASIAFGTWATLGLMNGIVHNMIGDKVYSELPDWARQNNFAIVLGKTSKGLDLVMTIPLSQEIRPFYMIGDIIGQMLCGNYKGNPAVDVMSGISQVLPVNYLDGTDTSNDNNINSVLLNTFVPDAFKPAAQVFFTNRDYTGRAIYDDSEFRKYVSEYKKARKNTSDLAIGISQNANRLANMAYNVYAGKDVDERLDRKSYIDGPMTNPDVMEFLFNNYGGGVAQQYFGAVKTLVNTFDKSKEVSTRDIPFVAPIIRELNPNQTNSKINASYKGYVKDLEMNQAEDRTYRGDLSNSKSLKDLFDMKKDMNEDRKMAIIKEYKNDIDGLMKLRKIQVDGSDFSKKLDEEMFRLKKEMVEKLDNLSNQQ